ncbi:hypothetical protein FRC14_000030 [Serendipita sp. 396]|nr:hypothetical protein FRC14_000030 [Serendipita sp. 396]KAG8789890.1 hypothetical protein FRC15_000082 [Serendipita sp. 397]
MATRPTTPNIGQPSSQQITNYQLGDCLGKGAFAQVFRALNWTTGETVAIKQIQLTNIAKGDLGEIMAEIDLLKNLNHPNIVKYKGFVKTNEYLNIILEYCENGSLHNICKRFGKFPESLVAVYISQVLHGLVYLHDQGVIHRDIKGANILTNKDGCVKLADFGVATAQVSDSTVVGSPYWMAPEVIEQLGATTASDIWSVGCVVIELLEGKPPYHFLDPMPALFRIVQDDCPPIPEGASSIVKDFLYHCFQKDCNLRISAKKLLRHPWMISAKKQMNSHTNATSSEAPTNGAKGRPASNYNFDDAVQKVQQWNEALKSPTKPAQPKRVRSPSPTPAPQGSRIGETSSVLTWKLASPPARSRSSSAGMASGLPFIPNLLPLMNPTPVIARPMVVPEIEEATDNWDDDFEEDITLTKLQMLERSTSTQAAPKSLPTTTTVAPPASTSPAIFSRKSTPTKKIKLTDPIEIGSPEPDDVNARTIKPTPTQSPTTSKKQLPPNYKPKDPIFTAPPVPPLPTHVAKGTSMTTISTSSEEQPKETKPHIRKDSSDENYDDLFDDDDDLFGKVESFKIKSGSRRGPFFPSDIRTTGLTAGGTSPGPKTAPILPRRSSHSDLPSPTFPLSSGSSKSRFKAPITPPSSFSRGSTSDANLKKFQSQTELTRYTEEDDEDYEDVFGKVPASGSGQAIQTLKLNFSNKSWLADDGSDSDEEDPFAEIDEEFPEDNFETNLQRDKYARLCAEVNQLIEDLTPNSPDPTLRRACDQIVEILDVNPDMYSQVVSAHGMLAILEVLESKPSRDVVLRLLEIINLLVDADYGILESFCLIGGIPVLMGFTSKKYSSECRLEASKTIRMLCHTSVLTLQMFISCRGLRVLVDILDEDYVEQTELVSHALNGIGSVFDLQSPTPKNDFCRMFIREGLLDPLSTALINVITAKDNLRASEMKTRIIQILLVFTQASQSDVYVRNAVGTRKVIRCLLRGCELVEPEYLIMLLKAIKHLSMSPSLLDVLQNANSIEILITLLTQYMSGPHGTEISNSVFQTCYNLCRLNKSRQEEAAQAGILPCLKRVIVTNSPLRQFALPILCDMASAGKSCRSLLWQHDGISIYLDLLSDPYFQVSALEAILSWLQDDMARVEDVLAERSSISSILKCFVSAKANSFENILDPLLKIVRTSSPVAIGLARPEFFQRLTDRLTHQKAIVRLNLLKLLKTICDIHPDRASLVERFGLYEVVERLSRTDSAVLVRELAREIVPVLLPGRSGNKLLSKHNISTVEARSSVANRSTGALLDPRSLDEIAKGRRPLNRAEPIFPPRKVARRAASETSSPPLGALSPIPRSPDSSLLGESGTAKRVRPVPIQRRSARDAVGLLASSSPNASGSGGSLRQKAGNDSAYSSQEESRANKRRSTAL